MSKSKYQSVVNSNRNRAERFGLTDHFTAEEWEAKLIASGYKCASCDSGESLSVDHVVPLSLGGTNTIANIQVLCRSCNSKKSNGFNGAKPVKKYKKRHTFIHLVDVKSTTELSIYNAINTLERVNQKRYSDNDIAKATGLHRQTIATLRKGKPEPTIAKLLDFFRNEGLPVTVADLFTVE